MMSMLSVFSYAFNALAPVLGLAVMGYLLKKAKVFDETFYKNLNTFGFHYCIGPMLFLNLYNLDSIRMVDGVFSLYVVFAILLITLLDVVVTNRVTSVRNRKGVMIQAGLRSNFAVVGYPLVEGLAGTAALSVAASVQASTIIYFNVACVLVLSIYGEKSADWKKVMVNMTKNPLLRGLVLGLVVLFIREFIPVKDGVPVFTIKNNLPFLYNFLNHLSKATTAMVLVSMGGRFEMSQAKGVKKELVAAILLRLVLAPLVGFSFIFGLHHFGLLDLNSARIGTMIALFGGPVAVSSTAMASEMNGDDILAGQIVIWTSLFSVFTIFTYAVVFRFLGML
ncbi:MAG: AEC family transporter [Spirochaetales bacterium]|nr:AEC family transporter [Candidatus Physcosoma equi]